MRTVKACDSTGKRVTDPSTGVVVTVDQVKPGNVDGEVWLLWGEPRPKGSIGCRVPARQELTLAPGAQESEPSASDLVDEWNGFGG